MTRARRNYGIVMTNVLHHFSQPRLFFTEATRCVRSGGVISMVEPWVTPWSRFVYSRFHHEPLEPGARSWELSTCGPLSGANDALPWIIFARDRLKFEQEFPDWRIETIKPIMPFRYLVSGGVSLRSLCPGWSFRAMAPHRERSRMLEQPASYVCVHSVASPGLV
jgi:hypothetical protein